MARQIYLKTYVVVGFISLLVFSLGFLLSVLIDDQRLVKVEKATKVQELNYKSLQFQQLYLNTLTNNTDSCPVFGLSLQSSIKSLTDSLERMEGYKVSANFNQGEFNELARAYVLDNLRYWLFAKRTKELCDLDFVSVLYFYSDEKCSICPDQGVILSYYKKLLGDRLLVFPINTDLEANEASIEMLKRRYNVTTYPTIIVGEGKYEGVVSKSSLMPIVCGSFKAPVEECSGISSAILEEDDEAASENTTG
ncbi:hypothetical protein HYV85_03765 [Candidatus Woesearchaeota archaeon]|nr:hypothetical protein [Candidatus Woesearchaeota archaeon]